MPHYVATELYRCTQRNLVHTKAIMALPAAQYCQLFKEEDPISTDGKSKTINNSTSRWQTISGDVRFQARYDVND